MHGAQAGIHAALRARHHLGLGGRPAAAFGDEFGQRRVGIKAAVQRRMLGGERDIGRAHQRVRARREHRQRAVSGAGAVQVKANLDAARAPDPVALHLPHPLRPFVQLREVVEQLIGVIGDAQEPLRYFPALDARAGTPAKPVNHLFVGEHGLVHRVPVDPRLAAIGQPPVEQPREKPLLPAVIVHLAGGELALPVVGVAEALQLAFHLRDVVRGPLLRRDAAVARGVLGGQAESVPAHRLQHILAEHALVAADDIADGVVADMPHVQLPAGVRKHGQAVKLLARVVAHRAKAAVLVPVRLRDALGLARVVGAGLRIFRFCHRHPQNVQCRLRRGSRRTAPRSGAAARRRGSPGGA